VFSSCFHQVPKRFPSFQSVPNYVPQDVFNSTSDILFHHIFFWFKFINYSNMGNIIVILYDNVINNFKTVNQIQLILPHLTHDDLIICVFLDDVLNTNCFMY